MSLQNYHLARAESKRRDIIQTASRLFAKKGFNNVSTATLASEAGVSSATLFKYFTDKETLFGAVVESLITQHIPSLANGRTESEQLSLTELCYLYSDLFQDETVIGLLRAVIADTSNVCGFRQKLEDHGSAVFRKAFEIKIRALLVEQNPSEVFDLEQATIELVSHIESQVLFPQLFHEDADKEEYDRRVEAALFSWRKRWLLDKA